jgi:hypothetical protein
MFPRREVGWMGWEQIPSGGSRFAAMEEGEPAFEGRTVGVVPGEHARRLPRTSIMISSRARTAQMGTGGVRAVEDPFQDNVQSKGASEGASATPQTRQRLLTRARCQAGEGVAGGISRVGDVPAQCLPPKDRWVVQWCLVQTKRCRHLRSRA